jgi:C-terminal processing protease CtpA/Prc
MRRFALLAVRLTLLTLFLPLFPTRAETPSAGPVANPGFEEGEPGQTPPGWRVPSAGYTATIVEEKPAEGRRSVMLSGPGATAGTPSFGNIMQVIDATPFRGKRIVFSAAVRVEGTKADDKAQLWVRIDREGDQPGFFDNMSNRPIGSATWGRYRIVADVVPDAKSIHLGMLLFSSGRAWLDAVSFTVIDDPRLGDEPARPLTGRGLDNLAAFTRLFGVVRWFHPSDQVEAVDWNGVALAGAQRAEPAADAAELARTLEDFFRPLAPTVRVFAGSKPPLPEALRRPPGDAVRTVAWRHMGVNLGPSDVYRSLRVDDREVPAGTTARMGQDVDATPFRGKKVRLRTAVRAELPEGHHARLVLEVFGPNRKTAFKDEMADRPLSTGPWREVEITGEVAADAETIQVGLILDRQGKVWIDDVSLEVLGDKPGDPHEIDNPSFEVWDEGWPPDGWDLLLGAEAAGYSLTRSADQPHSGKLSALLASADPKSLVTTKPDEPLLVDLGGGVSALVPLALWADATGTLPHPTADFRAPEPAKPEGFVPSGNDRLTRLADVVLAWNVFQHFYPYFDVVRTDWPAALRTALRQAAADPGEEAFTDTLSRLVAALEDGHGNVFHGSFAALKAPALAWDWIEDRLIVTWSDPEKAGGIRRGDAILAVDGKPAREALEAAEALQPAATPQFRRVKALSALPRGSAGSEMKLEVQPLDGPARTVAVPRNEPLFGPGSARNALQDALPGKIAELRPGFFYVDLSRITLTDFQDALDRLTAARGVVFDLRGYPTPAAVTVLRHLTDIPIHSAEWQVPLATRPDHENVTWVHSHWTLPPKKPRLQGKIAFLTGGGAISFAESIMGIVEAAHLGEIVGGPTAGTNGDINPFLLPGGYRVIWTGLRVIKNDGSRHHGVGILPTVPAAPTQKGVAAGRDEVLEKGLAVVGG